jgi:hypothetical protein
MPNQLALANVSGVIDRNAVRVYEREKLIRYSVTLSGAYVNAVRGSNVGEVLDVTKVLSPTTYQSNQSWGYKGPVRLYVLTPGNTGYGMTILPGADAFHWLLKIFSTVTGELAAGAYPAALTTDLDIVVEATGLAFD